MSTFRTPVGPQPPQVYWRRRLLLALGAVAVIVIIILIFVRPGSSATPAATKTPAVKTSVAASPSPSSSTPVDASACAPANVKLEAVTDGATYAAGVNPQISMKITNTGAKDCTLNLGSTQQELIVTSGTEQIWDSKDCQTAPVDAPTTLKPGVAVSTTPIPWDRTRSSTTTCNTTRDPVTAGGASYHLGVKVGTLASKATVQFILN